MHRTAIALRALIVVHLVWTFLLTPLGLEPRPFASITLIGWLSLVLIFSVVALDIAAFLLLGRRPRTAFGIASAGPFLLIGPVVGDQAGYFSALPPPPPITVLEVLAVLTQLAILYVAAAGLRRPKVAA
jgi:hypothetical protein